MRQCLRISSCNSRDSLDSRDHSKEVLMNAKQKLHQANLAKWTALFHEQASSGLTVKNWCAQNNISIHKYNYWKRMVKEMYVDSVLPDIVPISPMSLPSLPSALPDSQLAGLRDLRDSCCSMEPKCISIVIDDIRIEIGPSASDEMISGIIKAVRHV